MPKLVFTDGPSDMVRKLADGNMGATACLYDCARAIEGQRELGYDYIAMMMFLDEQEIYGEDLYLLWSDLCEKRVLTFTLVLQAATMSTSVAKYVKEIIAEVRGGNLGAAKRIRNILMLPEPARD